MTGLQRSFKDTRVLLAIGLVSLSLVASELVWTRIFSAELFYTFAFLTLSIAVMGLGLAALSLRLSPRLQTPGTHADSKYADYQRPPDLGRHGALFSKHRRYTVGGCNTGN